MELLLGIDVGTSSAKVMLLDAEKGVLGVEKREYAVSVPQPGYAEQDPELWRRAILDCINRLRQDLFRRRSGQSRMAADAGGYSAPGNQSVQCGGTGLPGSLYAGGGIDRVVCRSSGGQRTLCNLRRETVPAGQKY